MEGEEKPKDKNEKGPTELHNDVKPFKFDAIGQAKTGKFLNKVGGSFLFQETIEPHEVFGIEQTDLSPKLVEAIIANAKDGETVISFEYLGKDASGHNLFLAQTL